MTHPLLSIVMPVRDGGGTLGRAMESCLSQEMDAAFELLVIDDGSTDGSRGVMEAMAAHDARVVVLETARGGRGLVPALRLGQERARGEFVGRMDADDVSLPGRFAVQLDYLREHPGVAVCGCGVVIRRESGDETVEARVDADETGVKRGFRGYVRWMNGLVEPRAIAAERFIESPMVHPSVVMRRETLLDVGGYRDVAWAEDFDLWLRFLEAGHGLGKVPEILFEWWDGPQRLTRTDERYSLELFLKAKAHYLSRMELVTERGVVICGAGPTGKRLAALLRERAVEVERFLEVHPRRIGEQIGGVPVLGREAMPRPGDAVLIGAVGQRGRRGVIREMAAEAGFREGEDFFCVA